jgi:hypothetical protein
MGAALAEDLGLEMAPNESAQAAFLEKLDSISDEQFTHALRTLQRQHQAAPAPARPAAPTPASLLLKDATLEDIVRHLHAMGIEPTFRHVLKN